MVFLAVLFAAACHAGWNALIKIDLDPLPATTINCGRLRGGGVRRFCLLRQNRPQAGSTTLILPLSSEVDLSFDGIDAFGDGLPYIQTCSQ